MRAEKSSGSDDIQRYYDENTRTFLRFGHGRKLGGIRRAVWGPGVHTRADAIEFIEQQLLNRIAALADGTPHVLDLGCGTCTTLCRMAERLTMTGTGITLSPLQAELGALVIDERGLSERICCLQGDFTKLPSVIRPAHAAFAIESFVHGRDPVAFFSECARIVRPGGLLLICDDFLSDHLVRTSAVDRWLERFTFGWHINTLITSTRAAELARAAGFDCCEAIDFSQFLELNRVRDRAIALLMSLARHHRFKWTYGRMLLGGNALQRCLVQGWIRYLLMVFRRTA